MQPPIPLVALPADEKTRQALRSSVLIHAAPREAVSAIVQGRQTDPRRFGTWNVHLRAGQGWAPGKWSRDYSVLTIPFALGAEDYGRYIYFFAGEPGFWARFKNLTPPDFLLTPWKLLQGAEALLTRYAFFTLSGADVIQADTPLYWRADDRAVVIRTSDIRAGAEVRPANCPGFPA